MSSVGRDRSGYRLTVPGKRRGFVLDWAGRSDIGRKRAVNEDSVLVGPLVFAVADGMGGHAAGDRASAAVVERLAALAADADHGYLDIARLDGALSAAADDIDDFAAHIPIGAGTTVTGALLALVEGEPNFAVFNIGDSRVYLLADDKFSRVTRDHSVVQEMVDAGLINERQAEDHPDSNVITRAVGFRESPRPDLWMLPLRPGMRLLLCSDGLTKEVDDRGIRRHLAAGGTAAETADHLMDAALAAGGRDNVTVVVIDVTAPAHQTRKGPASPVPSSGGTAA
ncbi:protein phosphatase 2C domain-containing protein [Pseudolysinimonas sp.]|uniref:PP2C family protein-serine/threonine phosphatase n=1 Tax=Pseudolysinimonas sp. TaxID=2680009 RepID=UPI00286C3AEB|nr:protein phosphatase 2C domain-containing protein [Pseudolysinimonas sp.]